MINFHELSGVSSGEAGSVLGVVLVWLLVQAVVLGIVASKLSAPSQGEYFEVFVGVANWQFLLTCRVLAGPLLGLIVNIVYCRPDDGRLCYDSQHVALCVLAALILLVLLVEVFVCSLFFFYRNPLSGSYLGQVDSYYVLSKTLLKAVLPIYFAMTSTNHLAIVYMYCLVGLLGGYIVWHRLFAIVTYRHKHSQVEYFMEAFIFWLAVSNVLYYYLGDRPTHEPTSFLYALVTAAMFGLFLNRTEQYAQNKFLIECLQTRVKKTHMEKLILVLVDRIAYSAKDARLLFLETYNKLLRGVMGCTFLKESYPAGLEVESFLHELVEELLLECNSHLLRILKFNLLRLLNLKCYALYQSLELSKKKIALADEFAIFVFSQESALVEDPNDKVSAQFRQFYHYHEQFEEFEGLVTQCACNNSDYWDELMEGEPSLVKIRNLASKYVALESRIADKYNRISDIIPNNSFSTKMYLSYLMEVGNNIHEADRMREKLIVISKNRQRIYRSITEDMLSSEDMCIITLDTHHHTLGTIVNTNVQVRNIFGLERESMVGKNINKFMPKIYSKSHNGFVTKFIRQENSELKQSVKRVVGLNKHQQLVDLELTTRVMNTRHNILSIVGVLKKFDHPDYQGLILYSNTTRQLMGVDPHFQHMTEHEIRGSSAEAGELTIDPILPLKMEQLEKEDVSMTLHVGALGELGNCDQRSNLVTDKKVKVRLEATQFLDNQNICLVSVIDTVQCPDIFDR